MRVWWLIVPLLAACVGRDDPPDGDGPADSEVVAHSDDAVETDTEVEHTDAPPVSPWGERTPTFAEISEHVIRKRCVNACHINPELNGNLLLDGSRDDHGRLVNVHAVGRPDEILVVPGEPEVSYLAKKLVGEDVEGGPMPVDAPLPRWAVEGIRAWIRDGAPNDGTWPP